MAGSGHIKVTVTVEPGVGREQERRTSAGHSAGARHFDGIGKVEIEEWSPRPNQVEMEGG